MKHIAVGNNLNGAKAPFPPDFLSSKIELTQEIVEWYYSTENTISVNYYNLDDRCSVVEIVQRIEDKIVVKTETIGKKTKELICHNYLYYHH